jgi:hypothetical protein
MSPRAAWRYGEAVFAEFQRCLALSEEMVAMSSKETLVRTARILTMQAAHYATRYGEEPLLDFQALMMTEEAGEAAAVFLRDGAKTFIGVLGVVAGGIDKQADEALQ